jgi:branched-chain amino acid transport system substrate-binding protein
LSGTLFTTAWFWNMDDKSRAWADRFKERTGKRPTFDHAAVYSAVTQYLEAVQRAGTDDADAVRKELDGMEFTDFFARNATIRAADHSVVHDSYLVKVKNKADMKEDYEFTELVRRIPADEAFRKPTGCDMS